MSDNHLFPVVPAREPPAKSGLAGTDPIADVRLRATIRLWQSGNSSSISSQHLRPVSLESLLHA